METWPDFRFGQEDLTARSVEPSNTMREYFPQNQLYGTGEIHRQYAGLPPHGPVPWAAQTVVAFMTSPENSVAESFEKRIYERYHTTNLVQFFVFDRLYARLLRSLGFDGVTEVGHTFLYARELHRRIRGEETFAPRRGTVALPDKSDQGKLLDFDREAYAAKLAALPEEYQPVYVSMHWRDHERGYHEPYLRAGLKMVCAGHPAEPIFYHRLYDTFRHFKYSCSNEISTSFALSVVSGCQFFYLDGGPVTIQRSSTVPVYNGPEPHLATPGRQACLDASPLPPTETSLLRQRELAATITGEQCFKSPEFFHESWNFGRAALSKLLTPADLILSADTKVQHLSPWLIYGIDLDGWADATCGMEVPWREGFTAVRLHLQIFSSSSDAAENSITLSLDEDPAQSKVYSLTKGRLQIRIPLAQDHGTRRISLHGPEPRILNGETRSRSFRLARIEWCTDAEEHSQIQPSSVPKAHWFTRLRKLFR